MSVATVLYNVFKMILLKLAPHLPGATELRTSYYFWHANLADTSKLIGPRSTSDKNTQELVKPLCIMMSKVERKSLKSMGGLIKAKILQVSAFAVYGIQVIYF